jgi:hypothetical protein
VCCVPRLGAQQISRKTSKLHHVVRKTPLTENVM